jgi:hypothetical protein
MAAMYPADESSYVSKPSVMSLLHASRTVDRLFVSERICQEPSHVGCHRVLPSVALDLIAPQVICGSEKTQLPQSFTQFQPFFRVELQKPSGSAAFRGHASDSQSFPSEVACPGITSWI